MTYPRLVESETPPQAALEARPDDELMTLAQAGSRQAFAVLVERHARQVVRLCRRFVGDAQLGEELAQETWVTVWRQRAKYRAGGQFRSWLITVARNLCRNELRSRKTRSAFQQSAVELERDASPEQIDAALQQERRRQVQRALDELTPAMREALLLRYGEELRYDEMSGVVGVGEATLRSRVLYGLRILKQKLEKSRE